MIWPCCLLLLSACCAGASMIVKGGSKEDGDWLRSVTEGRNIARSTNITMFWVLAVVVFGGVVTGDISVKTGGVVRVNGGGEFVGAAWCMTWTSATAIIYFIPNLDESKLAIAAATTGSELASIVVKGHVMVAPV